MSMHNRKRRRNRQPEYASAVLATAEKGLADGTLKPGQVYVIPVRHDGWCDLLKGIGPCNCVPEVRPPERVPSPEDN